MSFKALTNYPVFILTLISLLAISYVSLAILDKMIELENNEQNPGNSISKYFVKYYVINGSLYLETYPSVKGYVYELILYANNTHQYIKLSYENGLFGPLLIPENMSKIILLTRGDKTELLDILYLRKIPSTVTINLKEYLPPSLTLDLDMGKLSYVESFNGMNWFYKLTP